MFNVLFCCIVVSLAGVQTTPDPTPVPLPAFTQEEGQEQETKEKPFFLLQEVSLSVIWIVLAIVMLVLFIVTIRQRNTEISRLRKTLEDDRTAGHFLKMTDSDPSSELRELNELKLKYQGELVIQQGLVRDLEALGEQYREETSQLRGQNRELEQRLEENRSKLEAADRLDAGACSTLEQLEGIFRTIRELPGRFTKAREPLTRAVAGYENHNALDDEEFETEPGGEDVVSDLSPPLVEDMEEGLWIDLGKVEGLNPELAGQLYTGEISLTELVDTAIEQREEASRAASTDVSARLRRRRHRRRDRRTPPAPSDTAEDVVPVSGHLFVPMSGELLDAAVDLACEETEEEERLLEEAEAARQSGDAASYDEGNFVRDGLDVGDTPAEEESTGDAQDLLGRFRDPTTVVRSNLETLGGTPSDAEGDDFDDEDDGPLPVHIEPLPEIEILPDRDDLEDDFDEDEEKADDEDDGDANKEDS